MVVVDGATGMDGMIVVVAMDADDEGGTWTGEDDPAATAATGVNMGVDVDEATIGVCAGVLEAGRTRGAAVDAPAPDVIEALDPNPKALNAPENVDRPSRFAVRPPVASTPAAVRSRPGTRRGR